MEGEAPLEVVLTDNSIRGSVYKWEFGDDSVYIAVILVLIGIINPENILYCFLLKVNCIVSHQRGRGTIEVERSLLEHPECFYT